VVAVRAVATSQQSASERFPGRHREVEGVGHGQQVALDVPPQQAVGDLEADEARPAAQVGERHGLGDDPGGRVRDAGVEHLPRAHEVVEGLDDLLDGGERVPDVQPVEVDVVGAKTLETRVDRPDDALAMSAAGVRVGLRTDVESVLGRHDPVIAVRGDCWDLLRQRRARRDAGGDPDDAQARDAETVERYLQ
jgi:hypothetical protein